MKPEQTIEEINAESSSELAERLAGDIAERLSEALSLRGRASLVVSGGSTPRPMFEALCKQPLDWGRVFITLADERWVAPDHADSNERMVRAVLLQEQAQAAQFISLKTPAAEPAEGLAEVEAALAAMPTPFDVLVLGMGGDGHTASLFPDAPELATAMDMHSGRRCAAMHPASVAQARITLTLPALLQSRVIYLHIVGEGKRAVYENALESGDSVRLPIAALLQQREVPLRLFYCDCA